MQIIDMHRSHNIRWAGLHLYGSYARWSAAAELSQSAVRRAGGIENPEWSYRITKTTCNRLMASLLLDSWDDLSLEPEEFRALTLARVAAEIQRRKLALRKPSFWCRCVKWLATKLENTIPNGGVKNA